MKGKSRKLIYLLEEMKNKIMKTGEYTRDTSSAVDCIDYLIDFEKERGIFDEKTHTKTSK